MASNWIRKCKLCNGNVQAWNCETHLQQVHQILTEDGMRLVQSVRPFQDVSQPNMATSGSSLRPSSPLFMSDNLRRRSPTTSESSNLEATPDKSNVSEASNLFMNPLFGKAEKLPPNFENDSNERTSDKNADTVDAIPSDQVIDEQISEIDEEEMVAVSKQPRNVLPNFHIEAWV